MKKSYIVLLSLIAIFTFKPVITSAGVAEIAGSATTTVVLQQLFADLNTMINKARNDGDYLLARAGVETKDALEAWKSENKDILNTAFKELDKASHDNFSRAYNLVSDVNTKTGEQLAKAQEITENANQIVESIIFSDKASYVLRYLPRIVPPQESDTFILRIRGVNLDKANPILKLSNSNAKRDQPGPLEAQFTIPVTEIPRDKNKILQKTFPLIFSTPSDSWFLNLFGQLDEVKREITLFSLPEILAIYEISGKRTFEKKEEKAFTRDLGQFKAKNSRQYKVAKPENGWKWDVSKPLTKHQGRGESGRCEGVDMNNSSENGVSFFAHLDKISKGFSNKPGYVNCKLSGTIYRMVSVTADFPKQNGSISWVKDLQIPLPSDYSSFSLKVATFDKRERLFTNTGTDRFFDVNKNIKTLVITPKIPKDIFN